jgi:uncharacterized membrane protein
MVDAESSQMALLLTGITVWSIVHLFPAIAPQARENMVFKLGENAYRGLFSLLILAALAMIVFGWKSSMPTAVYVPPVTPGFPPSVMVFAGLVLFFASKFNTYAKRNLRHPQMAGTFLWAAAHLLTNGDSRSLALFGGFAAWALLEVVLCNRRDGPRAQLPPASLKFDLAAVLVGGAAWALIGHFHLRLFGVAPM